MSTPIEVVRQFCDLMSKRDAEVLRPFVAEDATYQNVGMAAVSGADDILKNLAAQFGAYPDSYAYETVNIAAVGETVLTERLDYIRTPAGDLAGIPVMGTFVLKDGRISRWTDYWDTGLPKKFMTGEDTSSLVPAQY
ncbi:MAG: limonene-1,2-epoxide hydrolase [Gordonia sp.]|nr:limonene-1,2-epoxide hydrolase [Gordonia sp. (in: high G+C Gram-positive bacteria)]